MDGARKRCETILPLQAGFCFVIVGKPHPPLPFFFSAPRSVNFVSFRSAAAGGQGPKTKEKEAKTWLVDRWFQPEPAPGTGFGRPGRPAWPRRRAATTITAHACRLGPDAGHAVGRRVGRQPATSSSAARIAECPPVGPISRHRCCRRLGTLVKAANVVSNQHDGAGSVLYRGRLQRDCNRRPLLL